MCLLTGAGNAHLIASYNDNLLSRKKFLSHYTSETTKKVITSVDYNGTLQHDA